MSIADRMVQFEESPDWQIVMERIEKEFTRHVTGVKASARVGNSISGAREIGWCDALEWVGNLPKQIRKDMQAEELAKENKNG